MIDRYIGNADVFPILKNWAYFNHAGASPWPIQTTRAVQQFAEQFAGNAFLGRDWFGELEVLRGHLATLIGARGPDEVAIVRNTSDGICAIASGLDWKRGDRIVSPAVEYPSNVYPWMDACERQGAELITVPERVDEQGVARVSEDELLATADHHRTKIIALSHVQWASGQRMDIEKIGAWCKPRGVLFAVDVIQSLGVVPVDVQAANVDFLFTGGHKWLMAPAGAGILYCRRELIERVVSPLVGALSVVNPFKWELNFTRSTTATRFETGTHAFPSLVGMKPSIDLLMEVGIDPINAQVRSLGDAFARGIEAKGYTVATPRADAVGVGGAVCFTSPTFKPGTVVHDLKDHHRTELAARSGRVRFAPHFYNTLEQVDRLLRNLPAH